MPTMRTRALALLFLLGILAVGCSLHASQELPPAREAITSTAPLLSDAGVPASQPSRECSDDQDCALTLVPEGDCCERLCKPRPVTRDEEQAIALRARQCDRPCPAPACAPRRWLYVPACVGGRCTLATADAR